MRISSVGLMRISEKISVSIFSFAALFMFFCSQGLLYASVFLFAALLHELSHIYFLNRFGAEIKCICIFPFGVDINADTSRISYKKELICTLAGSFSNLAFAFLSFLVLYIFPSPALLFFTLSNLFLGIMNLLPLSFFDGGKAIRLVFYDTFDIDTAFFLYRTADILSAVLFLYLCTFAVVGSHFNFSVCAVICYASVSTLALWKQHAI